MSNQHRNLILSAEEKVELLTKALAREKSARQMLEDKVTEINNTQFNATKELLASYETARIRQIQLQFLSFLNRENIEDKSIAELTKFFVENVLQLLGQSTAVIRTGLRDWAFAVRPSQEGLRRFGDRLE